MSRTAEDLQQMALECRRLASTCDTAEAEQALQTLALELDQSAAGAAEDGEEEVSTTV